MHSISGNDSSNILCVPVSWGAEQGLPSALRGRVGAPHLVLVFLFFFNALIYVLGQLQSLFISSFR